MVRVAGRRRWQPGRAAAPVALSALLVAAAACGGSSGAGDGTTAPIPGSESTTTAAPATSSTPATASSTAEPPAPAGPAAWRPCGQLTCASVAVPLDYGDPGGPTISIALVRRAATGTRLGSVFVNPGGPGASGVDFVANGFQLDPETARSYDLIGFDPRGVGASTPVACTLDRSLGPLPDWSPDSEAEVRAMDDAAEAFARSCAQTDATGLLAHLRTDDVARDLDQLRAAVGDEQLHYIGFSFGTLIGLVYADAYPQRVGHLVLDGVVDPEQDLTDLLTAQAVAFEQAFAVLDAACGTRITCPPGGVAAAHDELMTRIERAGPVGQVGPTELDSAALITLYDEGLWPVYASALTDALAGDFATIEDLSDTFTQVVPFGAYAGVECTDSPRPADRDAWAAFTAETTALAPRFGPAVANELLACAWWPVPAGPARGPVTAPGARPILVVGNTNDPATPLANARAVAGHLEAASLVVAELDGHTAYSASACVRDLVRGYLLRDEVPPDGSRC
ncbi:MAG: alpha/beta hydrolase [Acidimicrobiales bacterium]